MPVRILYKQPITSFNSAWIQPIVDPYISFEPWDPEKTYPTGTLFYFNCINAQQDRPLILQLQEQGFRIVVDNLWEITQPHPPGVHVITCKRFFWYNESCWYRHLQYDRYCPSRQAQYRALLPMNRQRTHRTDFLARIDLKDIMWSYVEQGRQLPGDLDMNDWNTQRYFNPDWYDQTYASMVVESVVHAPVFITEKTMKPLAFQHPFIVYGSAGVLSTLRAWGFETFNNLWDESYDQIVNTERRRDAVVAVVNSLQVDSYSSETLEKLQHNRNHFFDRACVANGIVKEIIEPLLHYAET